MISVPGNKNMAAKAGVCLTTAALVFGSIQSEKKAKIRLYEKKYASALASLQSNNQQLKEAIGDKCDTQN